MIHRTRKIVVVSGEINIGKTTALQQWLSTNHHYKITGFLTPKTLQERIFLKIDSNTYLKMLAEEDESDSLNIGKYKFSISSFNDITNYTLKSLESKPDFVVLDEIGPLELKGLGFHELLKSLLSSDSNLILVIRNTLLEDIIQHYKLYEYDLEIIEINHEKKPISIRFS
jgi:nucleoside-triphosphatase THEP1